MSFICPFIEINPKNNISGKIKDEINFEQLLPNMYHNEKFVDYVNKSNYKFIPHINYYNDEVAVYFDIYGGSYNIISDDIEYNIKIYFYTIKNIELLTSDIIQKFKLIFQYDYFVKNNILNMIWHEYRFNKYFIDNKHKFTNLTFTKPDYCKTNLFNHQKNNLARMFEIHYNPTKVFISDNMPMYFQNELIYDMVLNKFISADEIPVFNITSGMILDEPGTGKTLQFIIYLVECKLKSLVLVPNNLIKDYWIDEYKKHICIDIIPFDIMTFEEAENYSEEFFNEYEIIGIDEIHNLYKTFNMKLFNKLINSNKYRWGITGTPFVSNTSFFNIIRFLTGHNFKNERIVNSPYIQDQFIKYFLKNSKIDIEYDWAEIIIEDVYVKLDVVQQRLYDAEKMLHNTYNLRKLICEINLLSDEGTINTPSELKQFGINRYTKLYEAELEKLENFKEQIENIETNKDTFSSEDEYNKRIAHFKQLYLYQKETTDKYKKVSEFFMNGIEEINKLANNEKMDDEDCPICCSNYSFPITYIKTCGHYFCKSCIDNMIQIMKNDTHIYKCPLCRCPIESDDIINVNNISDINYSSKIHELLKLIKDDKYIIFTQFDKVISNIRKYLLHNNISNSTINNYNNEQILLLSSKQNAEGINLSNFNKMIIFEPFEDNIYSSQVEKQLIARIHRVGRIDPVIVYRFITLGTIEEEIYSRMK